MFKNCARSLRNLIATHRRRSLATLLVAMIVGVAFALALVATSQAGRREVKHAENKSSPHRSPHYGPHTLYCGLWRTDSGFVSTAQIKNILETTGLQVTPVIYLADGTELDLEPMNLEAGAVATLNINDSLRGAPGHASDFGSLALRFVSPSAHNMAASMQILNEPQSLILTAPFRVADPASLQAQPAGRQVLEGVWWKHDAGVESFVSLSNASGSTKEISLEVVGSRGSTRQRPVRLESKNTQMIDVEPLLNDLPETERQSGGIRVRYEGHPQEVAAVGGLLNDAEGYSATIQFQPTSMMMTTYSQGAPSSSFSWISVGMMTGTQDPMMSFPSGTAFTPYAVLRNTTEHQLQVEPVLYLMAGSQTSKVPLPSLRLNGNESRQLALDSSLSNFSGMATLVLSFEGMPNDLLVATGSVDQTGTYVFEVQPASGAESWAKRVPYWSVANGFDSMTTVFNSGDSPQDIVATLSYAGGTGHYSLPLHLDPGQAQRFDVHDLIDTQQPDAEGNVIPRDVQQGGILIASSKGKNEPMSLAISSGLFNVQTATCGGSGLVCQTTTDSFVNPAPIPTAVGQSQQASAGVDLSDGSQADETSSATWSSQNTSVATVSGGLVNGVAVGSTNVTAQFQAPSTEPPPECPPACPMESFRPTAPVPVTAYAQISSVTLSPGTITFSGQSTITVQIYHQDMSGISSPTVDVQVSTASTNPAGIIMHYNPSGASPVPLSGASPATATFTVNYVSGGTGTVVIQASLSNPSPSSVTTKDPAQVSNGQATLTVAQ